jgi:glycosyltransferase involved in cell wall biosynthesis
MNPLFDPKIAIVIPVFKHSVFLSEAIEAAIEQVAPYDLATVVVDDGCPFPETTAVGASYALDRRDVFFLRKPNGGLSSARNYGIDFSLAHFPNLEAVYFLDADNRIAPSAIETALDTLRKHPDADWVYPNIDKFGAHWNGNFTPPYSRLLHVIHDNICEAGSLVSRRMLDRGCRFDEDMRSGMEDWEFWLQGVAKGMKGVNAPNFGFEYRLRGESMLSNTERERQSVSAYIQKKHKALFSPRTLVAYEHDEAPRYAQIDTEDGSVRLFVDPAQPGKTLDYGALLTEMSASAFEPDHFGAPDFMMWLPQATMDELVRVGLASTVLRALEARAEGFHFIALRLLPSSSRFSMSFHAVDEAHPLAAGAHGWFARQTLFRECVADPSADWVETLKRRIPWPRVAELIVEAPFVARKVAYPAREAVASLLASLAEAKSSGLFNLPVKRWNWREACFPAVSGRYLIMRERLQAGVVNPHCYDSKRIQVGIALPIASFGGVEKVAFALANVLSRHGCDLHLFCFGKPEVKLLAGQAYPFKTTNFMFDADYVLGGGSRRFMGHELRMEHEPGAKAGDVVGLLAGLDVIIAAHVDPLNAVVGRLRRFGVKVINHLHVIDQTPARRGVGHPYLALGFEHAYDAVLTCSENLKAWFHGMGVPNEKLVVVHNAPGYAISPPLLTAALQRRADADGDQPLRAVFLGRLDEQKGGDRLIAAIKACKAAGLNIVWRVIGSSIIADGGSGGWADQLIDLGIRIEPPIFDSDKLSQVYLQNDVFVLVSRWEGAPLSIIEAQRLGCVPIATSVGAVSELIDDGVDGCLLPEADDSRIRDELVDRLAELAGDRKKLTAMRGHALNRGRSANWEESARPVLDLLRRWFPGRVVKMSKSPTRICAAQTWRRGRSSRGSE